MKRLFVLMSCAMLLSACKTQTPMPAWKPAARPVQQQPLVDAEGNTIERIPFRAGVSSVTVENMAKAEGCVGGQGAGLLTEAGPVETYRMICNSNRVYMARCEFRQCKPLKAMPSGGYSAPVRQVVMPVEPPQPVMVVTTPVAAPVASAPMVVPAAPLPAPMAAPAPVAAPVIAAAPVAMGAREVPKLALKWACGTCVENSNVAVRIRMAYAKEAMARGYTVSPNESATMTITSFGPGVLAAQTQSGGKSVAVSESAASGITGAASAVGVSTFRKLAGLN
jgi:uncharacterized lipoprotein YajG